MRNAEETEKSLKKIIKAAIAALHSPSNKNAVVQDIATVKSARKPTKVIGYEAKFWIEDEKGWSAVVNAKDDDTFVFSIGSNVKKGKGNFAYSGTFTEAKELNAHLEIAALLIDKLPK